jgi:hypothetical protein
MLIDHDTVRFAMGAVLALMILLFVPGAIAAARFLAALRKNHESKWIELGRPTLVDSDRERSRRFRRFMRKREYAVLRDPELDKQGGRARGLSFVVLLLFYAFFALLVVAIATSGR